MRAHDCRLLIPALSMWIAATIPIEGQSYVLGIALVTLLVSLVLSKYPSSIVPSMVIASVCTLCTCATTYSYALAPSHQLIDKAISGNMTIRVSGIINSYPISKNGGCDFILTTSSAVVSGTTYQYRYRLHAHVATSSCPNRFDAIQTRGHLQQNNYAERSDAQLQAHAITVTYPANGWNHYVNRVHDALMDYAHSTVNHHDSLIPGVAVGDDSRLPPDMKRDMRNLGLSHLTAVSGSHISLMIGLVLLLIGKRRPLLTGTTAALAVYLLTTLVSPEPSVSRAVIMGMLFCLGLGQRYTASAMPLLSITVMAVSLLQPSLVRSLGFQLSVVAVAAIVIGSGYIHSILSALIPPFLADAIGIPFLAGVATAPLLVTIQDSLSVWTILANALIAPVVAPLTILGLAGGLLAPIMPIVGTVLFSCAGICTWWMNIVVHMFPSVEYSPIVTVVINAVALGIIIFLLFRYRPSDQRSLGRG
ncbi:ComEC/Rec2 family competence protein [Arcanobacterium phocae]|uniref:ComEC/Rec2 family competence protein n=3 Tax=Arcanobacterium phocae TaxID=131112 RepID=UPI001C0F06CD|nr:ComEC/Rec2 family competence protein [Arcanobacterium phocae]